MCIRMFWRPGTKTKVKAALISLKVLREKMSRDAPLAVVRANRRWHSMAHSQTPSRGCSLCLLSDAIALFSVCIGTPVK